MNPLGLFRYLVLFLPSISNLRLEGRIYSFFLMSKLVRCVTSANSRKYDGWLYL